MDLSFTHRRVLATNSLCNSHDGIVTGGVVRLGRDLPDGRLIDAGHGDDRPDIAGIEGSPLDSWQRKLCDHVGHHLFEVSCRKNTVWLGYAEHILSTRHLPQQTTDLASALTPVGKYRD